MTVPKPRQDTVRIIDRDELPERARNLPDNLNPFEEGVLMKHQIEWLKIKTDIKACPKGRRTGITFAESFDAVFTAAASKEAGGMSVYYIGDTKEKGLEFIGYCAKFSRVIAEAQGQVVQIEEFLFEDQNEKGETRQITAYRIRYASGFRIVALSSRPENIRGLQGKVVIDEAAFHPNVQGVMEAATALLIWGGQISVISSHNGKNNPFNQFVKDIENGVFGEDAAVHVVTFDDAVANGLYECVCFMQGKEATLEGKKKWYTKIRKAYGSRKAAMREELDAIPRDGSSVCLPALWVERAMPEVRTILRLTLGDDFTELTPDERDAYIDDWIQRYLEPELQKLDKRKQHCAGQDYARHRDFSFILPFYIAQDLRRIAPFAIEMHKVPSRLQQKILWYMLDRLPRFGGIAMDATGSGETIAENTAERYGEHMVHQIKLSRAWYGLWTPKLVTAFEEDMIDLPRDENLKNDCSAIEEVDGIHMVTKARTALSKWRDIVHRVQRYEKLFQNDNSAPVVQQLWRATNVATNISLTQKIISTVRTELAESEESSLTPIDLAVIRQHNRQNIMSAIKAEREQITEESNTVAVEQIAVYKEVADQVHLQIQELIELRPPVIKTTVTVPCTLHWLAHQLYEDMNRATEIRRLNPDLQNPALLLPGMELTVYAR